MLQILLFIHVNHIIATSFYYFSDLLKINFVYLQFIITIIKMLFFTIFIIKYKIINNFLFPFNLEIIFLIYITTHYITIIILYFVFEKTVEKYPKIGNYEKTNMNVMDKFSHINEVNL
jgi:hypothetical protein